jgi:hypothetical protein
LTGFISSIDLRFNNNTHLGETKQRELYEFHLKYGVLIEVESMLSCSSNEHAMIYDHYNAVQNFNYVNLHLPKRFDQLANENLRFTISIDTQE